MFRRFLLHFLVLFFAFGVLFVSILKTASVKHSFTAPVTEINLAGEIPEIDYFLPAPGSVLPDSPFWPFKAVRDQIWLLITRGSKRAELYILFADKRLVYSQELFRKGNYNLGATTLEKAEGYLFKAATLEEELRRSGDDTLYLSNLLSQSALKHIEVISKSLNIVPEDARPFLGEIRKIPERIYQSNSSRLRSQGFDVKTYPFGGS